MPAVHDACKASGRFVKKLKAYVEEVAPWALAKDPDQRRRLEVVLYKLLDSWRCSPHHFAGDPESRDRNLGSPGARGSPAEATLPTSGQARSAPAARRCGRVSAVPSPRGVRLMWFDSHCHLQMCDEPLGEIVDRARSAGVSRMSLRGDGCHTRAEPSRPSTWTGFTRPSVCTRTTRPDGRPAAREQIEELLGGKNVVAWARRDWISTETRPPGGTTRLSPPISIWPSSTIALVIHHPGFLNETSRCSDPVPILPRLVFHCWSGEGRCSTAAPLLPADTSPSPASLVKNASLYAMSRPQSRTTRL